MSAPGTEHPCIPWVVGTGRVPSLQCTCSSDTPCDMLNERAGDPGQAVRAATLLKNKDSVNTHNHDMGVEQGRGARFGVRDWHPVSAVVLGSGLLKVWPLDLCRMMRV